MLSNEKVILRPITFDDVVYLNKWKNDYEIFKYLGGGYNPISIDQHKKWMDNIIDNSGNNKRFIIEDKEKKAVGFIGLYNINFIHRTCELGIYIGEKAEWKKGYAYSACILIEEFAKKTLNLRKIKLNVVFENVDAVNMYKKLKYIQCGLMKEDKFINGEYRDVIYMEKMV
jgi:diamine N-acetyltransferase